MAQPIRCDWSGHDHLADANGDGVMVSRMSSGETLAYCGDAFTAFCLQLAELQAQEEADRTAAETAERLASLGEQWRETGGSDELVPELAADPAGVSTFPPDSQDDPARDEPASPPLVGRQAPKGRRAAQRATPEVNAAPEAPTGATEDAE